MKTTLELYENGSVLENLPWNGQQYKLLGEGIGDWTETNVSRSKPRLSGAALDYKYMVNLHRVHYLISKMSGQCWCASLEEDGTACQCHQGESPDYG